MPRRDWPLSQPRFARSVRICLIERTECRPATKRIGVRMVERVSAGLLDRSLREHRRGDRRRENSGHKGWDELCHDEHPSIGDLTYVGAATRKQMGITAI